MTLVGLVTLVISIAGIIITMAYSKLPPLDIVINCHQKSSPLTDTPGEKRINDFDAVHKACIKVESFPLNLKNAVLATEDKHFYDYAGIDLSGKNTITQQIARDIFISKEDSFNSSFSRLSSRILLRYKIDWNLSKDEILAFYLNRVYLGQDSFGFPEASLVYFGKTISELTLAESAMLAGLPKAPSSFNPIINPEKAKTRQMYVLGNMKELGLITQDQFDQAKNEVLAYQLRAIKNNLLYKNNKNNIFIKVQEITIGEHSYHDSYYSLIGKNEQSLIDLKHVVDINSFGKMSSPNFFKDKNYVYVHQQFPARFPAINIIDVAPQEAVLLNDFYIKDNRSVYWLSHKLDTKSDSFYLVQIDNGSITLGIGDKYIFWGKTVLDYEAFKSFKDNFDKKTWTVLKQKHFPSS